jgi:hypothetical protein
LLATLIALAVVDLPEEIERGFWYIGTLLKRFRDMGRRLF